MTYVYRLIHSAIILGVCTLLGLGVSAVVLAALGVVGLVIGA